MIPNAQPNSRPLSGLKVLDIGTYIAGPFAATLLGDFGANVIKVEKPGSGDPIRQMGPFVEGESIYWQVEGRNKRSVTIDLRKPEGQTLFKKIICDVDILIENFRPGTMQGWGLGYEVLSQLNPSLIQASVSGFGQTGPKRGRGGFNANVLAFAGMTYLTGTLDRPPVLPGFPIADYFSATLAAFGIMMALHKRAQTGRGQCIDLAMYEAIFRCSDVLVAEHDLLGTRRERGTRDDWFPTEHYLTGDGKYIMISAAGDLMWQRLCSAMDRPDLAADFPAQIDRIAAKQNLQQQIEEWALGATADAISERLENARIVNAVVYDVTDILRDPHYEARQAIETVDHPTIGSIKMPAIFPKFSESADLAISPAESIGAHTVDFLEKDVGLSASDIERLRSVGVI